MKFCCLLVGLFLSTSSWCMESEVYRFRVYLKDKGESNYRVDRPSEFLTQRSIDRRQRQQIPITDSDLPISPGYKDLLMRTGGKWITASKWLSTVVLEYSDSAAVGQLASLSMVDSVRLVWKGVLPTPPAEEEKNEITVSEKPCRKWYGYAELPIRMLKGKKLHKAGFRGEGMQIAVIDAGFAQVDQIDAFRSACILGTHNVIYPNHSVFVGDAHGTGVFSCLAANLPHVLVGTAPEAAYWLIKSEESSGESPVEEDYWAAAVEFADSVGVDVVSSSLGYYYFDGDLPGYTHSDLDGRTSLISQAASLAAQKGILVFSSAGNEGNTAWQKITVPADADGIVTVGAVTSKRKQSVFSSEGYTTDGRVKPDVVALGSACSIITPEGEIYAANGTSFATPILAGLGACLWQALPELTAQEIADLIRRYASSYSSPTPQLGYGIPNIYKSYKKGVKYARKR